MALTKAEQLALDRFLAAAEAAGDTPVAVARRRHGQARPLGRARQPGHLAAGGRQIMHDAVSLPDPEELPDVS